MNTQANIVEQIWKEYIFQGNWIKTNNLSRDIINPATGEMISTVQLASLDNVNSSVEIAVEAQKSWKNTSFESRAKILRKAAQFFEENIQTFIDWNVQECGSTLLKLAGKRMPA
ncbi:aldehyde dehydrogenase family protein [Acinetobacter vivianii]